MFIDFWVEEKLRKGKPGKASELSRVMPVPVDCADQLRGRPAKKRHDCFLGVWPVSVPSVFHRG
jgi:hypothetical protein